MNIKCPHCGTDLPANSDAFCPDCRNALDEPPTIPNATAGLQTEGKPSGTIGLKVLGWLLVVGPLAANANAARRPAGLPEAFVDVSLLLIGIVFLVVAHRKSARVKAARRNGPSAPAN